MAHKRIAFVCTLQYNRGKKKTHLYERNNEIWQKSANLYARIEPEVKNRQNAFIRTWNPASNAINMFYKQIIMQRGLPFDVKIPREKPMDVSTLTEEEFNAELEKGYADMKAGRVKDARQAFCRYSERL